MPASAVLKQRTECTSPIPARAYGFDFRYQSTLTWETYASLVEFAPRCARPETARHDRSSIVHLVQGSDEYPDKR